MLTQTLVWFMNSLMMGRLGKDELAAGALVNTSYYLLVVTCFGFMNAIGVCIGQANGALDKIAVRNFFQQGSYLVFFISFPIIALLWNLPHFFQLLHQPHKLIELSAQYFHGIAWGTIGFLGYFLIKEFFSNLETPAVAMYIALLGLGTTIFLDYGFVHGAFGLPAWGMFGIGLANAIAQWLMFFGILIYAYLEKSMHFYIYKGWDKIHWKTLRHLLYLGFPMSVTYFFEAGLFNVATIIMGWIGINNLAAHQITLQCTEVIFVSFLAIAQTASIRIANSIGQNHISDIKKIVVIIVSLCFILAIPVAIVFWLYPAEIAELFIGIRTSANQSVYKLTYTFLHIAAFFIFLDGLQVIGNNILRSMKDAYVPLVLNLGTYWIIGIGSAWLLGLYFQWQGAGVWIGLTLGVATSMLTIWARFFYLYRQAKLTSVFVPAVI